MQTEYPNSCHSTEPIRHTTTAKTLCLTSSEPAKPIRHATISKALCYTKGTFTTTDDSIAKALCYTTTNSTSKVFHLTTQTRLDPTTRETLYTFTFKLTFNFTHTFSHTNPFTDICLFSQERVFPVTGKKKEWGGEV
jgi:hypothetical protein